MPRGNATACARARVLRAELAAFTSAKFASTFLPEELCELFQGHRIGSTPSFASLRCTLGVCRAADVSRIRDLDDVARGVGGQEQAAQNK